MIARAAIVAQARSWIGTPYLHQAALKGVGCDCLGLVRGVWTALYGRAPETPPPYSADWAEAGGVETLRDAALRHLRPVSPDAIRAGDVLLFRWRAHVPAKHLAIASEAGPDGARMVHAHDGAAVCEVALSGWWRRHLAGAFSFPDSLDQ
ncbi:NlpC/P60 family putative phage cell wall peptidase [Pseudochelatococcus lubricantis]|uniref:NlpC/P60 family putative phage cell wall peptidase n=1 Tax=Pseudochelatococcus lubricantis TaxID=1538102 RepID=A0ABX0V0S2_9HYPH|nr:peptidase P60 [Pseudochelatococcus lubricantis]NIJ57765.1 NlpC/P60 family putative phage cell wall peptidase [Pseudochelatococcus lubricantis]